MRPIFDEAVTAIDAMNRDQDQPAPQSLIEYQGRASITDLCRTFGFEAMREIVADQINRLSEGRTK